MAEDAVQTPLAGLEIPLPLYHGRKPTGMKTELTGAGNRIPTAHEIGATIVLLVEARVKSAGHDETDDGLLYEEVFKVRDVFEVAGDPGRRLLSTYRQAYRLADDQSSGRRAIENGDVDLSTAGVTDASGVLLTPEELAELRGDPVRAALDARTTPAVIVFSDGSRDLWPDEFEQGETRPHAGDRYESDNEDATGLAEWIHVVEVLHADTGETLEHWTEEQENERLVGLEANPVAYYRIYHEDGSLDEVNEFPELLDLADRVVAIHDDGTEEELKPSFAEEPLDAPPLAGETAFDDGLDPLVDEVKFVEDEDGYAAPVIPGDFPQEPQDDDFAFVDRGLDEIAEFLPTIADLAEARRILEAEKRGRGRSLKTRKGAVDLILRRIAELEKAPTDG